MKIYVESPLKGYAYGDGRSYDMPKKHGEKFIASGRGYEVKTGKSADYTIAELREMDLSDKDESFFKGDERQSVDQFK